MESLIAKVIADNSAVIHGHRDYGEMTASTLTPDEMARAVLAAINEAGAVEWGIRYGDGDIDQGYLHKSEALADIARLRERVRLGYDNADDHEPMTLLSRRKYTHTSEWERAE